MKRRLFVASLLAAVACLAPSLAQAGDTCPPPHIERVVDLRGMHPRNQRAVVAKFGELGSEWPSAAARIRSLSVQGGRWPRGIVAYSDPGTGSIVFNRTWWARPQGYAKVALSHEFGHHLEWWFEAAHPDEIQAFRAATAHFPWVDRYVRTSPHPEWEQFPEGFAFIENGHRRVGYLRALDLFLHPFAGE
jgi:hypothetical protein